MSSALFEDTVHDDNDTRVLPKSKVPEQEQSIAPSMARLINTNCTSQCETDPTISINKIYSPRKLWQYGSTID